ncbi:MAG: VWA domain-containing protein [Spirochaetaceae bacterium]|nr:VWA domain-containing protein [Spirochaetaceae bacterium]
MNGLVFNEPDVLIWLFMLIPLSVWMFFHYKRRFPLVSRFISRDSNQEDLSKLRPRYLFSSIFFLLFFAAELGALANPRMGSRLVREFQRGCDVVLAMDISRSMNIQDSAFMEGGAATRLERSREIAQNLVLESGNLAGNSILLRFGLALGKGRGVLAMPVSADSEAVLSILDALSSSTMSSRGTNLEQLLDAAASGFLENSPAGRQVILFSDGESLAGSLSQSAERLTRNDISLITVGIGSAYGALIPENADTPTGGESTMVRSSLHADTLHSAAARGGGAYIDGNRDDAVKLIAEKIFPLAENSSWVYREEFSAIWHLFVIAGLVFLLLSMAMKKTFSPRRYDFSRENALSP